MRPGSTDRRLLIRGGTLVTPRLVLAGGAVLVEGSRIAAVFPDDRETRSWQEANPGAAEVLEAAGDYVLPGFVDLHCHGGGGFDFMDGDPESIVRAARAHLDHGTTSILPTTLASSRPALDACLAAFAKAKADRKSVV